MEKVTINKIERLKIEDSQGLTSRDIKRKFGKSNDYVELHVLDLGGDLLYSAPNYNGYSLPNQIESTENSTLTSTLFIDPYKFLQDNDFYVGQYNVICNIHRKKIFSGLQADFKIHEISPSRTELKIKALGNVEDTFKQAVLDFISEIEGSLFNKDFTLNFGNNTNILGINIAYNNPDETALIKLYEPLPPEIEKGATFWVVEEIIEPLEFKVDLGQPTEVETGIPLRGPNFRIDTRLNDSIPSQFKVYNDFLENTNSSSLYTVMSSLSESIELSIDYTKTGTGSLETGFHFENFTHFGSAEERLKNFKYKLELLELFDRQINEISTIQGSVSSSVAVTSNINLIENKKAKLISGFDNYEKFLYYENHPFAWPKVPDFGIGNLQVTNSALLPESIYLEVGLTDCDVFFKPFNLRPTTSSEAIEWYGSTNDLNINYGGQILSASRFDRDNKHSLVRTIPEHVSMREENAQYITFTNMIGHYFDQIWIYIDHIGQIRNAHNSFKDGISKDLVYTALSSLGVEAFDQFENEELFEYIIGTNKAKSGSFGTYDAPDGTIMVTSSLVTCDNGGSSVPKGDITKEIWKRLYHNLPYLLKTKGTERGIKALMNCYGVPETILNVKEYGGPTTDSTTYKTFNYEKFSRALEGSSNTEGYFIKAPWAATSSLFTGVVESKPNRSEGKIIFSVGAIRELFNQPFPKTVELTATDLSVHTFTSNYDFVLHEESGLETAESLAEAIDAHPLFSASVFVREDLLDPAHEKYNLDIEIMLTQHLQGVDGNTEIKGTLFEDTLTPACGNPQQFPEVEFLTKVDFNGGGGINNSISTTTVIPGLNTCASKILIQNGILEDGTGNLINNGLFQDEAEFMDFVTDIRNGYIDKDISLYSFESLSPSATPLYLGDKQCTGVNDYGLFVIECFKADNCASLPPTAVSSPTTAVQGTTAVGTITIPNAVGGNNNLYTGETVVLTAADGSIHTFTLIGGGSVNSIGQDLTNQINANPNFTAVNLNSVPSRIGYALEITTVATGSNANTPIQGTALNMPGDTSFMSLTTVGFTGGIDEVIATPDPEPDTPCNATLQIYVEGGTYFDVSATQFTNYLIQGSTGDLTLDDYLVQALPQAQNQWTYNSSLQSFEGDPTTMTATPAIYISSVSILQGKYLTPLEILQYLDSDCGDVSSLNSVCYTNYTTFIDALNAEGIVNDNVPGINVNTKWSELKAPDIITHFPASSSCGCHEFTTGTITTTNVLTQQPTVNPSIPLGQGAQNSNYGKFGARFYADTNSSTFYDIPASVSTYFGGTNQNDGRLNNIGVWDGTNPFTGGLTEMNPLYQWIGFSRCINVPQDGEYLIGLAGDNEIRFALNGQILIEKNQSNFFDGASFEYWWVYKVNLTAGDNTIVLEGKNNSSIASFGCDIVGPFPVGTFNSETDFEDIDNDGITVGGTYYLNLEEAYKNNIIFSSEDELNAATAGGETYMNPGDADPTSDTGVTDEASNYEDPNLGGLPQLDWFIANDPTGQIQFKKFAYSHPDYLTGINPTGNAFTPCLEPQNQPTRLDANGLPTYWYRIFSFTLSSTGGPSSGGTITGHMSQYTGNGLHYTDLGNHNSWEDFINALNAAGGPETFSITESRAQVLEKIRSAEQSAILANPDLNYDIQVSITTAVSPVTCRPGTTTTGGEFNTQTNECPEGYLYNECTGLCEKTEIETTTGSCDGMVINPEGNGSFETSADFVDYFTDFDNGFYGQNIDDFYFESDEPLPWGTFVADQCTGSNGLPIRRVVGFRKDQSVLPVDNTLYTNYETFVNQLNTDGHGVPTPPPIFSELTAAIITSSFEGSCQHKTFISNPLTSDGTFPNPGSGNTGIVDFLEYYSEQNNNIQSVAIDGFSFAVAKETLETTTETCEVNADMFVFYDMTSMDSSTRQTAYNGFKAWHQIQVNNGYTGRVVHIQLYGERWILWPAWILNPQDPSLTKNYDGSEWYGRQGGNSSHNQTANTSFTTDDAMSGVDTHKNSTSNIRPLDAWVADNNAILNADQQTLGKTIPTNPTDPAYNGIANDANAIVVCFADESDGIPNQVDGVHSTLSGTTEKGRYQRRGTYHHQTDTDLNSHMTDWYEAGLYYQRNPASFNSIPGFGKDGNVSLMLNNDYEEDSNQTGFKKSGDSAPEVTDLWKIDYTEATTRLAAHGGNIATFVYPARVGPAKSHRAFPLHVIGAIESGPNNDGLLPVGDPKYTICTAADLTNITVENPYFTSGYGGLDQFGFAYNVTVVSTANASTFEGIINTDLTQFIEESEICESVTETIFTDPNVCEDENGNPIFHINEFFMDPAVETQPFTTYTDYISHAQNKGYALTLADTRLESQIGGPIVADECICADVCPNDLVLNDNTIITVTGSIFDQHSHPFVQGDGIIQSNNPNFTAIVQQIDDVSNALIINVTGGTLNFTDPLISITTGNQYIPDPQLNEFIVPQPQGVFANYDEYMNFISNPVNGYNDVNLNTLKFHLVDQSYQQITVEEEDCSIEADIYVFYDHTSMGGTARENAFNAINDWVLDLQATQGFNKNVYHIKANDERWVRWGTAAMEGLNTTLASSIYPIEPHLAVAENDPNINVYSNTFASSNGNFSTVGVPTGDILVICYLDEANGGYVDQATNNLAPDYSNLEPKVNWQTDHTDYITAYNNYTAGNVACFFYPTPASPTSVNGIYSATMLGALAGITSGDNNNGLLANPPASNHGGYDSTGTLITPGATTFDAIKNKNPYFDAGYGELNKYGWGTNITYPIMSSQQLSTDLNEFVSTSEICETETVQEITVDILCTGSLSTDINQYGLFTVEGFYQNALIEASTTTNQYASDSTFYTNWESFILQKIQEDGATGIDFLNNNGANISVNTTWYQLSASVELLGTGTVTTTTTTTYPLVNVFDNQSSIYNNTNLNSGIAGTPNDQLNWLIANGHGQNIDGYYFINTDLDETQAPYNSCTGANLPAGGGVYSTITDFTFTTIPGLTFSSAGGTYTSWHTFIDTVNSLNFEVTPGTSVTTFNQPCDVGINTGISGQTSQGFTYIHTFLAGNVNDVHNLYVDAYISDDATANVVGYYFEDTNPSNTFTNTCTPEAYRYGKNFQVDCDMNTHPTIPSSTLAANGYFGSIMQTGLTKSPTYDSYAQLIDALNSACNYQGDQDQFNYSDTPENVAATISALVSGHPRYEGQIVLTNLDMYVETCTCSTTTTDPTSTQVDIFTYSDDLTTVLNYFNITSETPYSANFSINFSAANCNEIPGPPVDVDVYETQSIGGNVSLYGQIEGGACLCIPEATGGEDLDGDIEFESCICCPESSSIEIGCLIAGEVSSSRCECSADTFETVIEFVSASAFDIIPSSSAKMVEFRIKPHRLDKPVYTSLEACCDPVVTIPTASHLFSLFNPSQPQATPHLILRPYTGSDVSSSDDFRNFGSLDLYKNGSVVGSTDIFPVYNGAFWNIFIGTKGESGSSSEVYFGAYQSNFLGHVTHLTASATFSEYERAVSFGDTAYNLTNNISPAKIAYFCGIPTNTNSVLGDVNTFEYSGSLQEIKYYVKDFLTHDTLVKHALDPFQYAGNTVSSSWNNVFLRLPLGSNNKVDSASYNNNGLGIIQNFNPHPSFSLYESSSISSSVTNQVFSEVYETHRHLTPDTVGISTTSEKVRIDSGSVDRSILSFDIRSETSTLDRQPLDYNDLGVFFSPQAEINEDIVYTLGAFRMDDFIGDPTHQSLAEYPDLEELKLEYFRKYLNSHRQNMFDYIRLIQFIDHTLFKVVEQFVPAKANLKTGLLIEPHYLERQKFARQIPTFERLEREAIIDSYVYPSGEVKQYEACINISDKTNENYFTWVGALTASDNLYMSQSKYASDECNPYITLYDNFDPLYGNFVDCIISKEYYYISKPPQFTFGNDPTNPGISPDIGINPVTPSKGSGIGIYPGSVTYVAVKGATSPASSLASSPVSNTGTSTNGSGGSSGGSYGV